jgi:hypothetical protein
VDSVVADRGSLAVDAPGAEVVHPREQLQGTSMRGAPQRPVVPSQAVGTADAKTA